MVAAKIRVVRNFLQNMERTAREFDSTERVFLESDTYISLAIKDWHDDYEKVKVVNSKIVEGLDGELDEYDKYVEDKVFESVQKLYLKHCAKLHDMLKLIDQTLPHFNDANSTFKANSQIHHEPSVTLPFPVIQCFDGTYSKWGEFKDDFLTLVHENASYNDTIKLKLLQTYLKGDALKVIRREFGPLRSKDYKEIWNKLNLRYNHKRSLVYSYFHALFYQPVAEKETAENIRNIYDTTYDSITSLRGLEMKTGDWSDILVFLVHSKLPFRTKELWDEQIGKSDILPKFDDLMTFLDTRCRTLEEIEVTRKTFNMFNLKKPSVNTVPNKKVSTFQSTVSEPKPDPKKKSNNCKCCSKGIHGLRKCKKFQSLSIEDRKALVLSLGYCTCCLSFSHQIEECPSSGRCYKCSQKHNTLLCNSASAGYTSSQNSVQSQAVGIPQSSMPQSTSDGRFLNQNTLGTYVSHYDQRTKSLFPTALLKTINRNGKETLLRSIIDQCSDASYISQSAVKQLQLQTKRVTVQTSGLGNVPTAESTAIVNFKVQSLYDEHFSISIKAYVLPIVSSSRPTAIFPTIENVDNLPLADPHYNMPGRVDMLLGCEVASIIKLPGFKKPDSENIHLTNSRLGWLVSGSVDENSCLKTCIQVPENPDSHLEVLDKRLTKFWEIEEMGHRIFTEEEQLAEEIYNDTTRRLASGEYVVSLPFKRTINGFRDMRTIALRRLSFLEKRLDKNHDLKRQYNECLAEYITLNHMSEVDPTSFHDGYYIPHHSVIKESSSTTKLRVVFDASAKDLSLISLNENLCNGPRLQLDLLDLLLQFRCFKYALTADIAKMYRQIKINPNDKKFQLIVWRPNPNLPVKTFSMNTVTFGTTSAPYLAIKTLQRLAEDERQNYPIGAECLINGFYVDDFIFGADTIEESLEMKFQTSSILKAGGFHLRKWSTNCKDILETIPVSDRETDPCLTFDSKTSVKTLGIQWCPTSDVFLYRISITERSLNSKRTILSDISKIFDPLGWISPLIIKAKILIQNLWSLKIDWDTILEGEINEQWEHLRDSLKNLNLIQVPRWLGTFGNSSIELHGFCDASLKAYAAVIYVKTISDGLTSVNLLLSKTKVAPFKKCSLPRLELCGAVLLSRIMHHVKSQKKFSEAACHYWSDSMVALAWLKDSPLKRKMFVANRITEIQSLSEPDQWRYVHTKENPADLPTRGALPSDLHVNSLWWNGPGFLKSMTSFNCYEPMNKVSLPPDEDSEPKQERSCFLQTYISVRRQTITEVCSNYVYFKEESLNKFSTLPKLVRVVAYCLRFLRKNKPHSTRICPTEYDESLRTILYCVQQETYSEEINDLEMTGEIKRTSKLRSLNPFVNESDKLLRVNSRLQNAEHLSFDQKYPVILPYDHLISSLLVRHAHNTVLHGTQQETAMLINQKYHIVKCNRLIKTISHRCIRCFRFKCKTQEQRMASLPRLRVTPARPFLNTGVDFAGPIELKRFKGKCNTFRKAYFAVYVCFATKAIHLELVDDLSTNAFIASFRRFISRRGMVANLHSDCGSNFIGAEKVITRRGADLLKEWSDQIESGLLEFHTTWHYNPPGSPHFGGIWEAGVKSVKYHLKRILGNSRLCFEEFETVLTQVEACLNSRPICKIRDDPNNIALTPGHFLIGSSLVSLPEPNLQNANVSLLDRWNFLQKLVQDFWRVWSLDYLNTLRQRSQWKDVSKNVKVDDVVILVEKNLPPTKWLLARIAEVHPGDDGLIRVVTIQTKNGFFKRPIVKLCLLPIEN